MNNLFDYIKWRGDLTFIQDDFNCIDSLIFSRLAYIRWEQILDTQPLSFQNAHELYTKLKQPMHSLAPEDPLLLESCAECLRYKKCFVSDFVNEISEEDEVQFCAITFHLPDNTHYIAFRGTDNTVVGWKEDLKMSCQGLVASHKKAKEYVRRISEQYKGKLRIGGHSKGGNLAMVATLRSIKSIQKRILSVDNFDGPGLDYKLYQKKKEDEFFSKIHVYIPQTSIIGRFLFTNESSRQVIQSNKHGIYQHDLYSWSVLGKSFVTVLQPDKTSERIDATIKKFTYNMTPRQLSVCIDVLFEIISSADEDTFHELSVNWMKHSPKILRAVSQLKAEERRVVLLASKELFACFIREIKNEYFDEESN